MIQKKGKFEPGGFMLKVRRGSDGLGLFTEEPIKKGVCVIEYVGKELTKEEEENHYGKYLFEVTKRKTIDGAARSNTARYINHSCAPNCEIEIRKGRVFVMAKKGIKAEEELSYDYDTDYFDTYIKPKGCRCTKCAKKTGTRTAVSKK